MTDKLRWIHSLVRQEADDDCRDWPWGANGKGYPAYKWQGQQLKVTHLVLELTGRPRPDESAWALHSCDRPRCVAPWHLRWGTSDENIRDKISRSRSHRPQGEANRQAKLSDEAVREIRMSSEPYRVLAAKYGVHIKTIAKVRAGKIWAHVEDVA